MNGSLTSNEVISWIFGVVFAVIGVLNLILVHVVPGVFYLFLSLIYFPAKSIFAGIKFNNRIPLRVKIIIGLMVLWGTLAVGS